MGKAVFTWLLIIYAMPSYAQTAGNERFVRTVNRLVEAMNTPDYEAIFREYDAGMSTAFPLNKTTLFFKNLENQYGKVSKIEPPQVKAADQAVCVMFFERGAQDLTLYLNDQGKIKGFLFTTHVAAEPPPAPEPAPAQTITQKAVQPTTQTSEQRTPVVTTQPKTAESKPEQTSAQPQPVAPVVADKQQTELYPPFRGTWAVISGGEFREGAAQRNLLQQQYAYEFSAMDATGLRYKNDGKANEDYIGYGKEVLAPADGIIMEVIDGVRENPPGFRNPYAPIGNAIIIQHSTREYSVLSFLKQGSTRVKVGDKIARGQVIGLCGSSGSATEPVIHYHLQDSPYMQTARGIKFYFERVAISKDGKKEVKLIHLPEMGEGISPE
jgi:murein DD-endopeptidase MepM/ murein hydrolase activator NlpD